MTRYEPDFLLFASDAEITAAWGGAFILLAVAASLMERRRMKRTEIHRVGWVPWTPLFLACAVIGGGFLTLSLPAILAG